MTISEPAKTVGLRYARLSIGWRCVGFGSLSEAVSNVAPTSPRSRRVPGSSPTSTLSCGVGKHRCRRPRG